MCFLSVSCLSQGTQTPARSCEIVIIFLKANLKKKKTQPQVLLLGRGSMNLPPCDRVLSPLRICHQLSHLQLLLWQRLEPSEPRDRGGCGSWGQTMLIGMGEWRGTLNFLVCGRS